MELWIRSQDNKMLFKAEEIEYIHRYPSVFNIKEYFAINVNECEFGEYETEKRALEIIDEIQYLLKPTPIISPTLKSDKLLNEKIEEASTYVYEMPKN